MAGCKLGLEEGVYRSRIRKSALADTVGSVVAARRLDFVRDSARQGSRYRLAGSQAVGLVPGTCRLQLLLVPPGNLVAGLLSRSPPHAVTQSRLLCHRSVSDLR